MTDETARSASGAQALPDHPSLEWLRKQAKQRLVEMREALPDVKLADAQFDVARRYGFPSWRALKAHIDALTLEGQCFAAAERGDVAQLVTLLDAHPTLLDARTRPYGLTLLHIAARGGHLPCVELLLERGLDVNARDRGDNTSAMHWAAASGSADVVRRLADAGGDVVGDGDDHELSVIGWAACWDGCDDDAHRAVAQFLVSRGARHHIFSAIALNLADEVQAIVAADSSALHRRMSRNEGHQLPLHFAVQKQRPEMVALLLDLGADPLGTDGSGYTAALNATSPGVDRQVMHAIRTMLLAEMRSADRGVRMPQVDVMDLVALLALRDWTDAERLLQAAPHLAASSDGKVSALHLMAKRGDADAVRWLLAHGADPNAGWMHYDARVTALHLACFGDSVDVARELLAAGADPRIRDDKHEGDARGWAEHFGARRILEALEETPPRE